MKQLTVNIVETIASDLLHQNGSTTTLDIKNVAREDGYWATQDVVAQSMYAVWQLHDWHWTFNGTYRTYYPDFESAEAAYNADKDNVHQTSWLGWLSADYYMQYHQKQHGPLDAIIIDVPDDVVDPVGLPQQDPPVITELSKAWAGDWLVFDYKQQTKTSFLSCNLDNYEQARTAVRTHYSRLVGIPRERVGASRVKGD
jgi:hypothetical protein